MARLARRAAPTSSTCSGSPGRGSTERSCGCVLLPVFTAHDLLPRRIGRRARPLARPLRALRGGSSSTASAAASALAELGVPEERLRVIPHPVFPSDPPRADDGRTLLALGVIRPYKGARRRDRGDEARSTARACSSSATRWSRSTATAPPRAIAPSGGSATSPTPSSTARSARRRSRVFPYRAELDQSGALLRALGAGVPAVVYDVGGLAEPVQRVRRGPRRPGRGRRRARRGSTASCSTIRPRSRLRARARPRPGGADVGPRRRRPSRPLPRARLDSLDDGGDVRAAVQRAP